MANMKTCKWEQRSLMCRILAMAALAFLAVDAVEGELEGGGAGVDDEDVFDVAHFGSEEGWSYGRTVRRWGPADEGRERRRAYTRNGMMT